MFHTADGEEFRAAYIQRERYPPGIVLSLPFEVLHFSLMFFGCVARVESAKPVGDFPDHSKDRSNPPARPDWYEK